MIIKKGESSRNSLEFKLLAYFEDISADSKLIENLKEVLKEKHNINMSRVDAIITRQVPITSIYEEELYLITDYLYNFYKPDGENQIRELNPTLYFLPNEIVEYSNYLREKTINTSKVVTFPVQQVNENEYICIMPVGQIAELDARGKISYNPQTQRQLSKSKVRGKVISKPTVINEKIKDIYNGLSTGMLNNYTFTLNIPITSEEKVNYKNNTLSVEVDGYKTRIDCIDGYHRYRAVVDYGVKNPDSNFNISFKIYRATTLQAGGYVINVDKQTKIDDLHISVLDTGSPYMTLAQDINRYGSSQTNELFNRLGEDLFDVENSDKYTTLKIMADAIEYNFDKDGKLSLFDRKMLMDYLIDGFAYIIGRYKNQFKNYKAEKETSIATEPNMFIGYIAILSELRNSDISENKTKLIKVLDSLDLRKEPNIESWKKMGMFVKKYGNSHLKQISEYFISKVKEV